MARRSKAQKADRSGAGPHRPASRVRAPKQENSSTARGNTAAVLRRELKETLEQQAATSDVLRVISSSRGELKPVFETVLARAVHLCDAKFGLLFLWEGGAFRTAALHGVPPALAEERRRTPVLQAVPGTALGRIVAGKKAVQIADVRAEPAYQGDALRRSGIIGAAGARTLISVPMLRRGELVGTISIYRQEVRAFTAKQIALLTSFAAQAVIAIENARLLNELRQRTDDLTESLEQQTATSEVLKVISSSPGELEPVFKAMLANAVRICEAKFGTLFRYDGQFLHVATQTGAPRELVEFQRKRGPFRPEPGSLHEQALMTKQVVHTADHKAGPVPGYAAKLGGARSTVIVPMIKDDQVVGTIIIYRQEVRPFTDKQIELVKNFAAQAVIAIENTRLLNELRQRTDDLSESLEQQTATSEVLSVISSSPGELEPVFDAILTNATRICEAKFGTLYLHEGDGAYRSVALHGAPAAYVEKRRLEPVVRPPPGTALAGVAETKQVVHIADIRELPIYARDPRAIAISALAGARSLIIVPMLKEGELVGAIAIYRQEVRPFTDKQIGLISSFAAQAVIAIENARLLNELRQRTDDLSEALERQTATSEVLKVISSSPGDLTPVFRSMLANATRICGARFGALFLYKDGLISIPVHHDVPAPLAAYFHERQGKPPVSGTVIEQVLRTRVPLQIPDLLAAPEGMASPAAKFGGARSYMAVPLLKDGSIVGAISVYRQEVRPFTDKQVELVANFAAQAVIAIENARLLNELRQRTDDLTESLEQQTATSEVLKVISSSPGDLQPVFAAILENATRICDAKFGALLQYENGKFLMSAGLNTPPELVEFNRQRGAFPPLPGSILDDVVRTKVVAHIADDAASKIPGAPARLAGARTTVMVPMLKDNELIGAFAIYRQEVRPFTDKQIELVTNFAAQAVIAIENTRLLNELRHRTDDLTESLEQQTATSEVLKVISSSPGDLQPVFNAMLENAVRICGAGFGSLFRFDGTRYHWAAGFRTPPELVNFQKERGSFVPEEGSRLALIRETKRVTHAADVMMGGIEPGAAGKYGGARSVVGVPMLKDNELVGAIVIYRQEVQPFTEKQIALVQNFAAQAVIAIENARLLNELRQRTDDLTESLEQQTATSEVLKVISSSPGDLRPVFSTMLENATRICKAKFGVLWLAEGDAFRCVALHNTPPDFAEQRADRLFRPGPDTVLARAAATKKAAQIADLAATPAYAKRDPFTVVAVELGGARTFTSVPMVKDNQVVGAINIYRQEVRPFTDKEIAVLTNFAAQAVIAIENTRLLNELRERTDDLTESLQQQTATADVLKVISRSTFDLRTVLDTLVESAGRLCRADRAAMRLARDGAYHHVASYGYSARHAEAMIARPVAANRASVVGRVAIEGKPVHVIDAETEPELTLLQAPGLEKMRTILGIPLLREGKPIGALVMTRRNVEAFTDKQIELVTTFADQAVIAIENVRLFDEIQDKSHQLEIASQHKSQFLANMSHELRTPLNAILGYTELIIDEIYGETPEKMRTVLERVQSNGKHLLNLINDVLDLSKIEAGELKLELADYSLKDVVNSVHGAVEPLATQKRLAFTVDVPSNLPGGRGDERRLTQVLLNLVGNAIKFTDRGEISVKASSVNGSFTVAVRDTGPGIRENDQSKIFEEFKQVESPAMKKKGGTGLGLSISRRIIEMHGGRLWVESDFGHGSTFSFTLPVNVERQAGQS